MTKDIFDPKLQLVAWEITRRCNLTCAHCRAAAEDISYSGELSTEECLQVIDDITRAGNPILILTGGEPLMRPDIFEIGRYATGKGLRVVLGTNGTLLDDEMAAQLKSVPVAQVGVSLDFPTAELQDAFRGQTGAFNAAIAGIKALTDSGIRVQINSTVTARNAHLLGDLLNLALDLNAVAFHPFMLVPTGRGKGLADVELSAEEYERILNWVYDRQMELGDRISFKPTDAPHYVRIMMQRKNEQSSPSGRMPAAMSRITRGCLAGVGFAFISHVGRVQGCGYLDVEAGDLKKMSFDEIWDKSEVFSRLRDLTNLSGKCGVCEFKRACGGCRARAYEKTGDYLAAEPYCIYQPARAGCEL